MTGGLLGGLLGGQFVRGVAPFVQSGALGLCPQSGVGGQFEGVYSSVLLEFRVFMVMFMLKCQYSIAPM